MDINERFEFRQVEPSEADQVTEIEKICFPPNEACSSKDMYERTQYANDVFLVAADKDTGKIAGFLNGLATNESRFRDEFFTDITLHDPRGENVLLTGLDVLPAYRRQGLAREIVRQYEIREREKGRKRLILTCLPEKIAMYESFGFRNLGLSASKWGGEAWYEMVYEL